MKKQRWLKFAVSVILMLLCCFGLEMWFQRELLSLPSDQKGIDNLSLDDIYYTGLVREGEFLRLTGDAGKIAIPLGGRYVNKFRYHFDYAGLMNADISVRYVNEYGNDVGDRLEIADRNSSRLSSSVVNIGKKVNTITFQISREGLNEAGLDHIDFSVMELSLYGFAIENKPGISIPRFLFFFSSFLFAGILWINREKIGTCVEKGFLLTALWMGMVLILLMPVNKTGWDEEVHFRETWTLSEFPGYFHVSEGIAEFFSAGMHTWPMNQPGSIEEKVELEHWLDETGNYLDGEQKLPTGWPNLNIHSYFGPAVVIKLFRLFGLPFTMLFRLGRFVNLLIYAVLLYLAIKTVPYGKRIMAVIGLMPTSIFQACVYTYDGILTALMYLGLALLLAELEKENEPLKLNKYLVTGAILFLGCIIKAVYAPMILCALLLPKTKFQSDQVRRWMRLGIILAFFALIAYFVLPVLLHPAQSGDLRGGATSEKGQLDYIFGHPFVYAGILLRSILKTLPDYLAGPSVFGQMGYLLPGKLDYIVYILVVFVIITDTQKPGSFILNGRQKLWTFLMIGFSIAMVWTSMYIAYTEPGVIGINGVQARYYIPLLYPIYLLFNTNRIQNNIKAKDYNLGVYLTIGVILVFTIYHSVLIPINL